MTGENGFIDLRLNRQGQQNQDSFWPSFTDIMTVVVMIFMIAMVILLLRNMELVRQLRATMEAERQAMELARSTGQEKDSLAIKLITAENELSMLRIKLMQLEELRQQQSETIGKQSGELSDLLAAKELLSLRNEQLAAEKFSLTQRLNRSQASNQTLRQDLAGLRQDLDAARQQLSDFQSDLDELQNLQQSTLQQLAELRQRYSVQSQELQASKGLQRRSGQQLNTLRGRYNDLKVKYDELVRPARTPEGRFLVEVRYSKVNGKFRIEYASAERRNFRPISRQALEQELSALKAAREEGLYIKIIFPDQSGLTFNEAWSFTSDLHSRYDYYSQGGTGDAALPGASE